MRRLHRALEERIERRLAHLLLVDNTVLNAGSGGDTIATDDIGGVKHQRVKVEFGADGTATDVTSSSPLPVEPFGTKLAAGNLVQADYDTSAGVQNVPFVGIALPASGGAVAGGTTTDPFRVDPTGTTTQPVSGTVTGNQGTPAATANRWPVQITDGTDLALVTASGAVVVDGSGVTQPISGTVTANAGSGTFAVDQANTAEIDYDTGAGTALQTVMGIALPASGGPVAGGTSTNPIRIDPTGTTTQPVSDGGGTLTVDGTVGISGTVTVDSEMPAAAALADATANPTTPLVGAAIALFNGTTWDRARGDTTNGLDVDVTRVQGTVTVSATNFDIRDLLSSQDSVAAHGGDAHDAAVSANPVVVGGRGSDAVPTAVSADGDATRLWVDRRGAAKAVVVDDAGDSCMDGTNNALRVNIVAGAGSGGTAQADESAFTEGSTSFTPIGGVLNDTITSDPTEDQAAAVRITAKRAIHVNLRDASGNEVSPGGGTQYDEDTASAAAEKVTMAGVVRKDTAATLVDTDGDRTELQVDASGRLWAHVGAVDGTVTVVQATASNLNATVTGTVNIGTFPDNEPFNLNQLAGTALAAPFDLDSGAGTQNIIGVSLRKAASGGSVEYGTAGDPIRIDPTGTTTQPVSGTVTANAGTGTFNVQISAETTSRVEVQGDVAHDSPVGGNPVLVGARANANEPAGVADGDATSLWADTFGRLVVVAGHPSPEAPAVVNATASGNTTIIAAPGSGLSLHICKGSLHNNGTAKLNVQLQDGAAGTTRFRASLAADGGGTLFDFGSRGWKLTANTLLNANLSAAGDVYVNITEYYIAA